MTSVAEDNNCRKSVAWARCRVQCRGVRLDAAIERDPPSTTENIGHNLRSLGISRKNELGFGASVRIRGHLAETGERPVVRSLTGEIRIERGIDQILIAAAGKAIAGSGHEIALASRVRFIVATGEKEVHIITGCTCLRQCEGGQQ